MSFSALYDVYVEQLKDMYSAEKQLVDALPKMAQTASTPALRQAFENHLQETEHHLQQVQSILDELDENPGNKVCVAMRGLVEEGNEVMKKEGAPKARDAALILAAQKVEHYEIATYGGIRAYARTLGYDDAADTIDEILDQEYDADQKLDDIAEGGVLDEGLNEQAAR
ncbi:MAG TPA: ferritin-like domain-containing protein [Candidatus Sulfomarinibacteraceae bacterium]|nr:ferritin-like domain-containing protein [Candidatus Sulfomarinibacteraceae bacterium]